MVFLNFLSLAGLVNGLGVLIAGVSALVVTQVSGGQNDTNFALGIISSAVLLLGFGFALYIAGKMFAKYFKRFDKYDPIMHVCFLCGYLFTFPFLIAFVFYFLSPMNYSSALFEAVSALTLSGYSLMHDLDMDVHYHYIRAFVQWSSGGIFLFIIAYRYKGYIGRTVSFRYKRILSIYIGVTALGIVALLLSGLGIADSFFYSLGAVSTGGYAPALPVDTVVTAQSALNVSLDAAGAGAVAGAESVSSRVIPSMLDLRENEFALGVLSLLMFFGIGSYLVYSKIAFGYSKVNWIKDEIKNKNYRGFAGMLALVCVLITGFSFLFDFSLIESLFVISSSISTTGYSIAGLGYTNYWVGVTLFLTLLGGYSMSLSGGAKWDNFIIVVKEVASSSRQLFFPQSVVDKNFNKGAFYFISYFISLFFVCILFALNSESFQDSFALGIMTLSNSIGHIPIELADLSTQVAAMISMLLGRIGLLYLFVWVVK